MGIPTSIGSRLPEVSYQCRIMLGEGRGSSRRRRITRLASKGKGETRRLQPFFMGRIIAELRHQLAVISAERNEPRPLDLQGRRTIMIMVRQGGSRSEWREPVGGR